MPSAYPDILLLWGIQSTVQYGFARTKLEHAIEHLEQVHERERWQDGSMGSILFMEGFDTYTGPDVALAWNLPR